MTTRVKPTTTAFIRLDARIGWRIDEALTENLHIDSTNKLALGRRGLHPIPPNEPFGTFGGNTLPTGVAVLPEGRVVLADPDGNRLLYYVPPFGLASRPAGAPDYWPFRPLWPTFREESGDRSCFPGSTGSTDPNADPYRLDRPTDVAFSPSGDLYVADSGNRRVIVYSWPGLRVRRVLPVPTGEPVAIVFDRGGYGYVADAVNGVVRRFDRLWRWDEGFVGGQGRLQRPEHLAIDEDGEVFVLDSATQRLHLLDRRGRIVAGEQGRPLSVEAMKLFERRFFPPLTLDGRGNLSWHHPRTGVGTLLPGIPVDGGGFLMGTDLPLLSRPRRIPLPRRGVYVSQGLDGGSAGFPWHRIILAAEMGASSRLIVQTLTSDKPLESSRIAQLGDDDWSRPLALNAEDLPEILVQSPPGRYLWLKIEFFGDGEQSPRLGAIEIQAPRRSSLQWLPPPFRSDPESADFLDRLLSYSDTVLAEIHYEIEHFARLLDPYSVPAGEFLDWLGSWFDWRFLAEWPESVRREMIAQAIGFFRQRGTVEGLRKLLQWHTGLSGEQPQIIEHFRLRDYATRRRPGGDLVNDRLYIGGKPVLSQGSRVAHWFTIVMPSSAVPDGEARQKLERVIEAQKPAHAGFHLRVFDPGIRVGCQSTVGVDMWLCGYPIEPLGDMHLGQTSRLTNASARGLRLQTENSTI